jgi:hypothetical protein
MSSVDDWVDLACILQIPPPYDELEDETNQKELRWIFTIQLTAPL